MIPVSLPPATDGRQETVMFDKITSRISKLCYGLNADFIEPVSHFQGLSLCVCVCVCVCRYLGNVVTTVWCVCVCVCK